MEPIVHGLAEEFAGEIAVTRLKVDTTAVIRLQESYGGRGHPFFVLIDQEGRVMAQFFGPQSAETLREAMTAVTVVP
jgi:thioredoxin-like negative regulator of GroEL